MTPYQTKSNKLTGTSLKEVKKNAMALYKEIASKTRRQPYVRSAYFKKQKIFFNYFWHHIYQKNPTERQERLRYFKATIDLIKNSRNKPTIKANPNKNEILYRFMGLTGNKDCFCVQIKENKKNKRLYLMSCFPWKTKNPPPMWSM